MLDLGCESDDRIVKGNGLNMIEWFVLNGGLLAAAYLLGSIPTGYAIGRWFYGIDIREQGSGSTGATNVLRTCGKGPALAVLLVDILKGSAAIAMIFAAYSLPGVRQIAFGAGIQNPDALAYWVATLSGLAAVVGHTTSLWIGFKGGKSVATSLGILFALNWGLALATLAVFAVVLASSRIVSLGSIAGAIAISALMIVTGQPLPYQLFAVAAGAYVIWRHRTNIERLLQGKEPRIGQKLSVETQ